MQITDFLRSHRLRAGYPTYAMMAEKAKQRGHNTSEQALNKAERVPQYMTPSTRDMYVDVLKLSEAEADSLDVLAARCQIRKGSNTNPYMTVIDIRTYNTVVEESCDMVLALVNDIISRKNSLSSAEDQLLKAAIKGALCRPINQLKESS
jgi:hypothetical protein